MCPVVCPDPEVLRPEELRNSRSLGVRCGLPVRIKCDSEDAFVSIGIPARETPFAGDSVVAALVTFARHGHCRASFTS